METEILAPAVVLVLWSLIMLLWMAGTRLPAMNRAGVDLGVPGGRGQDLESVLDPRINWKSHNYAHLMEQPTIFYPTVIVLMLVGAVTPLALGLAWAYVGLRIAHSLWQATVNKIPVRLALFVLGTLCLLALAIIAALAVF